MNSSTHTQGYSIIRARGFVAILLALFALANTSAGANDGEKNSDNSKRDKPWNDSRFLGVPDKPPAFTLERAFTKLSFRAPISMHRYPELVDGRTRWVVIEQSGKIVSFVADESVSSADTMIYLGNPPPKHAEWGDGKDKGLNAYSLAFHPNFKENRYVYICYLVQSGKIHPGGTHIARYVVRDSNPPTIDYDSETTILRCDAGGHNGCTLAFGPDGYLYISIGDLTDPTPPDTLKTGQDISDFYASILRIDVDKPSRLRDGTVVPYSIPADNPFVNLQHAKGEVYAFGLRNPWRMSFDKQTGQLWVGDVGWELYEMVYRVRSGSNLGWSIKEGPGDVMPDMAVGPTPIQPADIVLDHADAASVTGGYVYHGKNYPSLRGKYIFGDWITRRYWAASFDEQRVIGLEEIAQTEVKPICFAEDHDGEIFVLEYIQWDQDGGIYRFKPNPAADDFQPNQFPKRLSQTGLFANTAKLAPASGVFNYQLNSTMWMDGATAQFHIAVPGGDAARVFQQPQNTFDWFNSRVFLPKGSVLAKTYTLGDRKIETQVSQYQANNDIRFYTYRWLEDQSDAELVPASGASAAVTDASGDGLKWTFAARSQCKICHTPWSGNTLGFIEEQLRKPQAPHDSWRELQSAGVLRNVGDTRPARDQAYQAMVDSADSSASLNQRARSYLHSNCAHCHQFGGNGSAAFDLRWSLSLEELKCINAKPMKGDCGLQEPHLVYAGHPERSTLFSRIAKQGPGRMPHIGAEQVDRRGVQLISQWIGSLPKDEQLFKSLSVLSEPIQKSKPERLEAEVQKLTQTIAGSMLLARTIVDGTIHPNTVKKINPVLAAAPAQSQDYLEFLLPKELRRERLGNQIDLEKLVGLSGDASRGRELFRKGSGQCKECHKVDDIGKAIGPAFDKLATRYPSRRQLLEQIVSPSQNIAEEYRAYTILTTSGQTIVGRIVLSNETKIVLALQDGTEKEVLVDDIELKQLSKLSLMPENLLSTLTAQEAADLLEFLSTFR